jgi:hypothetical protein
LGKSGTSSSSFCVGVAVCPRCKLFLIAYLSFIIFIAAYYLVASIRFMNYNGCKRKFKVADFVAKYKGAAENAAKAEAKHNEQQRSQKKRKAPSK